METTPTPCADARPAQPIFTGCSNCGTCDHAGYHCPCGCHATRAAQTLIEAAPHVRLAPETVAANMRAAGRDELIHYAGAAHRDRTAWFMCLAWMYDPSASEAVLKSRALKAAWGIDVAPSQLEATRCPDVKCSACRQWPCVCGSRS